MVSAILSAVPSQFSIAFCSFSYSSGDAPTIANRPDIASWPPNAAAVAAFSSSLSPENPSRRSCMIVSKDFILPSESVREIPSLFIAPWVSFVGFESLVMILLSAVPA